jgi:hypothetical protein
MKRCCTCKKEKEVTEFNKQTKNKDGLNRRCRNCLKVYRDANKDTILQKKKEYWLKNRERLTAYHREKYKLNAKQYQKQMKEYYSIEENRKKKILWKAHERAKATGFDFS